MRACIFCGRRPVTPEHAPFPYWITVSGHASTAGLWRPNTGPVTRWRATGRSGHAKTKLVCRECNHGWLSTLERQASTIMRPLMADVSFTLSRSDQDLISVWCAKTAMVCDCLKPRARWYYTQSQREHLRARLLPPTNTLVWLGRYARSDILWAEGSNLYRTVLEGESAHSEGYATTFAVGRLILQIVTITADDPEHRGSLHTYGRAGPWGRIARQHLALHGL